MIEYGTPRTTDKLPVLTVDASAITSLTPVDFIGVPYTPSLLLRVSFDASITSDDEYSAGCASGFDGYLEQVEEEEETAFAPSRVGVCTFIGRNACDDQPHPFLPPSSLAWRVGFCVGWLSALAFTDRPLALVGLDLLIVLVNRLQDHA